MMPTYTPDKQFICEGLSTKLGTKIHGDSEESVLYICFNQFPKMIVMVYRLWIDVNIYLYLGRQSIMSTV